MLKCKFKKNNTGAFLAIFLTLGFLLLGVGRSAYFLVESKDNSCRRIKGISEASEQLSKSLNILGFSVNSVQEAEQVLLNGFRHNIEQRFMPAGTDLIESQRFPDRNKAQDLARQALNQMAIKLSRSGKKLQDITLEEFNTEFGLRPIVTTAGFGERYSPAGLQSKSLGVGDMGETNIRFAVQGAFKTRDIAPVVVAGDVVLQQILKDGVNYDSIHQALLAEIESTGMAALIDENYIDPVKKAALLPANAIIMYSEVGGSGYHLARVMKRLEAMGLGTQVGYYVTVFGELATTQDQSLSNASLITYLKAIAGDYLIAAGGKKENVVKKKGNFIFNSDGKLIALTDFEGIQDQAIKDELLQIVDCINTGKEIPPALRAKYPSIVEDSEGVHILINATSNVFRRDVSGYLDALLNSPVYSKKTDPKTGLPLILAWDLIDIVTSAIGSNYNNADKWPVGLVDVGEAPSSIKDGCLQCEFSSEFRTQLLNNLKKVPGLDASGLEEITIKLDPNLEFNPSDIGQLTQWLGNKNIKLSGKIHLDARSQIGENATIKDSYIAGNTIVGSNDYIDGAIISNAEVKDGVRIEADKSTQEAALGNPGRIIITDCSIGFDVALSGKGYISEDIDSGQHMALSDSIIGQLPSAIMALVNLDFSEQLPELAQIVAALGNLGLGLEESRQISGNDIIELLIELSQNENLRKGISMEGSPIFDLDNLRLYLYGAGTTGHRVIAQIFGRLGDKGVKLLDQINLRGEVRVSSDTRVGNGTYLEDVALYGADMVGEGWGLKSVEALGTVFSDNCLSQPFSYKYGDIEVKRGLSYYIPPLKGRMNSSSVAIDSVFEDSYIGAGSGKVVYLEEGQRGYYNMHLKNVVIEEGLDLSGYADNLTGVLTHQLDTARQLELASAEHIADFIINFVNGNAMPQGFSPENKDLLLDLPTAGKITHIGVVLNLIGSAKAGAVLSILNTRNSELYSDIVAQKELISRFLSK